MVVGERIIDGRQLLERLSAKMRVEDGRGREEREGGKKGREERRKYIRNHTTRNHLGKDDVTNYDVHSIRSTADDFISETKVLARPRNKAAWYKPQHSQYTRYNYSTIL